ncbi:MAG: type II toxin-antitoxin system RelE/ParE family toxin [Candidatus Binatia bacterium]
MGKRLVRKRAAEPDLADQVEYIAAEHPPAARRYLLAVERAFERLLEMREMGVQRAFENKKLAGLRVWPVPGFRNSLIFYRVTRRSVQIVRIFHRAQDVPQLLGETHRAKKR